MKVARQQNPAPDEFGGVLRRLLGGLAQRPSRNPVSLLRPALKVIMKNESKSVVETLVTHTSVILNMHHEAKKVPLTPQRCESGLMAHSSDQQSLTKSEEATDADSVFALQDLKTWGCTYRKLSGKTAELLFAQEIAWGRGLCSAT